MSGNQAMFGATLLLGICPNPSSQNAVERTITMRQSAAVLLCSLSCLAYLPAQTVTPGTKADRVAPTTLHIINASRHQLMGKRVSVPLPPDAALRSTPPPTEACLITVTIPKHLKHLKVISGIQAAPVKFNADGTCEQEYDIGEPIEPQPAPREPDKVHADALERLSSKTSIGTNNREFKPNLWGGSNSGYLSVFYLDPINITVNSVRTDMTWTSDTCCVTSVTGYGAFYKNEDTGWKEASHDLNTYVSCEVGTATAMAHYYNPIFCVGITTYADYYYVTTLGNNQTCRMDTSFYATVSGGCSSLLRQGFTIYVNQYC
jgi:hypothetical protein